MNAHCERFNRPLQESFVDFHEDLLFGDIDEFNHALELRAPIQFLLDKYPECHILWTRTGAARDYANYVMIGNSLIS